MFYVQACQSRIAALCFPLVSILLRHINLLELPELMGAPLAPTPVGEASMSLATSSNASMAEHRGSLKSEKYQIVSDYVHTYFCTNTDFAANEPLLVQCLRNVEEH